MALELEIDSQILADKYDNLMRKANVPGYAESIEDKAQHLKNIAASIKQGDIDFLGANIQSIIKNKEKPAFLGEAFAVWRQLAMFPHKKREDELLSGENEMFGIYQLKSDLPSNHDIAFASMDFMRKYDKKIEPINYELVYAGNLYANDDKTESEILEQLFERFNIDRPKDFAGHSLSMSDVVVLNRDREATGHYVDRIGYETLPEFVEGREHIIEYNAELDKAELLDLSQFKTLKEAVESIVDSSDQKESDLDVAHRICQRWFFEQGASENDISYIQQLGFDESLNYWDMDMEEEKHRNHQNEALGGNGDFDNVTDYDEIFDFTDSSVYEGNNPDKFKEQIFAMLTGQKTDGSIISEIPEEIPSYANRFDYIVQTANENRENYRKLSKDVEIITIYGGIALDSISQNDSGRFNLQDNQYTGTLISKAEGGLDIGNIATFTAEEILAVSIKGEEHNAFATTSRMNPDYEKMNTVSKNEVEQRTFRAYVENEKSAFDVTFFRKDDKPMFYIEDTGEYPLAMGEGTISDDFEFNIFNAREFLNELGENFDGKKDFILFDIHDPERTQAEIDRSKNVETLPVQLKVELSVEEEPPIEKYFYFNDEQNARLFSKAFLKEMTEFTETTGNEISFEPIVGERDDRKRELAAKAEQYTEGEVTKAFKAKTYEMFREIDGNNAETIENIVKDHVQGLIDEYNLDAVVLDVALAGSRCRGLEQEDSDVDILLEFYGSEREDSLFDMIREDNLNVGGYRIDVNPITAGRTGTLEEHLPQVEEYLQEKAQAMEAENQVAEQVQMQAQAASNTYANFKLEKHAEDHGYDLIADVRSDNGNVKREVAIAEFSDKKEALAFCQKNGIEARDVTNFLQKTISHKKHISDERAKERKNSRQQQNNQDHDNISDDH